MYKGFNEVPYRVYAYTMNSAKATVVKDMMDEKCYDLEGNLIGYMQHGSDSDMYYVLDNPNPQTTNLVCHIMDMKF